MPNYKMKPTLNGEGGGEGTTVVANPELVGDEPNLEGLEVGGAKYKVPQGGGSGVEFVPIDIEATSINLETLERLVDFNNHTLKPNYIVLTTTDETDTYPILMPSDTLQKVYRSAVMGDKYYQLTLDILEDSADVNIEQISVGGGGGSKYPQLMPKDILFNTSMGIANNPIMPEIINYLESKGVHVDDPLTTNVPLAIIIFPLPEYALRWSTQDGDSMEPYRWDSTGYNAICQIYTNGRPGSGNTLSVSATNKLHNTVSNGYVVSEQSDYTIRNVLNSLTIKQGQLVSPPEAPILTNHKQFSTGEFFSNCILVIQSDGSQVNTVDVVVVDDVESFVNTCFTYGQSS